MPAQDSSVALTQALVRIPSENPPTSESAVGAFVAHWLSGESRIVVERHEVQPDRANVIARLAATGGAPPFAILAHMDTVPVGTGWTHDPFGGEISDGKLFGRGSCDMEAGLAVGMSLLARFARSGRVPKREIVLCATVDEEGSHMIGGNDLIDRGVLDKDSLVVATEPTGLDVIVCHKGLVWMQVEVFGKLAHAGNPQVGVDAVRAAAEFITRLHRSVDGLSHRHETLGKASVTFSHASGGIKTNVVPAYARLELDIRLPPPMSIEDVHLMVKTCAAEAQALVTGSSFAFNQMNNDRPPVEADRSAELVSRMVEATREVTGRSDVVNGFPAYTDASVLQARTGNRTALVFGPGHLLQAHTVDEYVPVIQIEQAEAILERAIERLCF